jgi:flagellar biosynthetic protein FlhB
MAEEFSEKTEEATPQRRQEAHKEGRVPRSQELTTAMLLLGSALVLTGVAPHVASRMMALMGKSLSVAGEFTLTNEGIIKGAQQLGWNVLGTISLITLAMAAIALAINAVQARGVLSTTPITPKWDRINPLTNAKRIFGKQSLIELLKALLKVVIVGAVIYGVLKSTAIDHIMATAQQSPAALLEIIRRYTVKLLMLSGLAYLGLAAADYFWQYWQFMQQLRMTREELKQELKNSEGDPLLKQRMRSMARNMARRQMFRDVPKADVVIVNPTHRAIALEYDPLKAPAPIVLAMGQRKVAERIKKIALEHGVPVIENRPLAAALISTARVGMMIPAELYVAVAEILAFVFRQRSKQGAHTGYRPISRLIGGEA